MTKDKYILLQAFLIYRQQRWKDRVFNNLANNYPDLCHEIIKKCNLMSFPCGFDSREMVIEAAKSVDIKISKDDTFSSFSKKVRDYLGITSEQILID